MGKLFTPVVLLAAILAAGTVSAGTILNQGDSILPNGTLANVDGCTLTYQADGNLVLYFTRGSYQSLLWSAQTSTASPGKLLMQSNGNVVLYDAAAGPYWGSGSSGLGVGPFRLDLQDDCNLVIYTSDNRSIWATNSGKVRRTLFEEAKFKHNDILVNPAAPSCWLTYKRDDSTNVLALYSGTTPKWSIRGVSNQTHDDVFDALTSLYLTPQGQLGGWLTGIRREYRADWALGPADKGVAPYHGVLTASCTFDIISSNGTVVYSQPSAKRM